MPKNPNRVNRVADVIHKDLVKIIRDELKDPRLDRITISSVEVSSDLSSAKVYFTSLSDIDIKKNTATLNHAAGFLRNKLAKLLSMRIIPSLRFYYDNSLDYGNKIESLLQKANTATIANDDIIAADKLPDDHDHD